MLQKWIALAAASLLLAITACINFESQSVSFRHLPDKDTLLIFQQYNGITGSKAEGISDEEILQLDSVVNRARTFFFSNWILEYDRDEAIKRMEALGKPADPDDRVADPALRERLRAFNKLLVDNITIHNGPFFLDSQGKLCAIQKVTVQNLSKILAAANRSIRDAVLVELNAEGFDSLSGESKHLLRQFSAGDQPFIQFEGNRLTFRWPMDPKDVVGLLIRSNTKEGEEEKFWFPNFAKGGLEFAYVKDQAIFSLGSKDAPFTHLLAKSLGETKYRPNVVAHVSEKYKIQAGLEPDKMRDAFFGLAKPAKP